MTGFSWEKEGGLLTTVTASKKEHQAALVELLAEFDRVCRVLNIPYVIFAGTLLGAVRHQGFIPWDDDLDVAMLRKDYDRFLREADSVLDQEKFFLQKEFSEHWPMFFSKLRLNNTTCLEKMHPKDPACHQGVYMDIFPCDYACRSALGRRVQFLSSKVVIAKSLDRRGYDTDSALKKIFIAVCRFLPGNIFYKIVRGKPGSGIVHSFFGAGSTFHKNIYPEAYFRERIWGSFEGNEYPMSANYDDLLKLLYGDYMELPPQEKRKVKQHAILVDLTKSYEEYAHYRDEMKFDVYTRSIR